MTTTIKHIEHGVASDTYTVDVDGTEVKIAADRRATALGFHCVNPITRDVAPNALSAALDVVRRRVNGNIGRAMPRYGFGGES